MKSLIYFIIILGAGLSACSSYSVSSQQSQLIAVQQLDENLSNLENQIAPYRDSLNTAMNQVIAFADTNFIPERPSGNLNNWVADAVMTNQTKHVRLSMPIMVLLNTGGLRSTLNKGEITIGDIFKIMPFDNTVVWATIPVEVIPEIEHYLVQTGGEPISGATLVDGKLNINGLSESTKEFIIITSDYLANGGDKMYFFRKAKETNFTAKLMRDCLMEEATIQGTLNSDPTQRIILK